MFVEPDEIAERYRKIHIFRCGEWVAPEFVFETGDDDRETQRVEPRIQQDEFIVERR
jgi:predicted amidohydrolase